jgi:hypothetical protein
MNLKLDVLGRETRARLVLRGVVLLAPVLALVAARPDDMPQGWYTALTVVLAIGFAAMPESGLGTACLVLVVVWWTLAVRDDAPWTVVPVALLLVAAHLAAVLLSYGPPGMPLGAALMRRWAWRSALVGVAAPVVWLVAVVLDGQPEPPGIWVAGLGSAVVVCIVAATAVTMREEDV